MDGDWLPDNNGQIQLHGPLNVLALTGGDILAHSAPGEGSLFVMRIPIEVANEDGEATSIRRLPKEILELRKNL